MIIPDFTKNEENKTLMYFSLDEKKANELMDSLEKFYSGYSEMKPETVDGKKYIRISIDYTDF